MIKSNTILFARIQDPAPSQVNANPQTQKIAIVSLNNYVASVMQKSVERFGAEVQVQDVNAENNAAILYDLVIIAEGGDRDVVKLHRLAKDIKSRYGSPQVILQSFGAEDRKAAQLLIEDYDAIVGFPISDEKFHYALRRMLSKRSNFPMRHFDAMRLTDERPVLTGWWILPFAMSGVLVWVYLLAMGFGWLW